MRPQTPANIFICRLDRADEASLANIKMEHQRWPERALILERSVTQYVAMVIKLFGSYCGAHLVESHRKESISFFKKKKNQAFLIQIG